jgi:hypothetical protein
VLLVKETEMPQDGPSSQSAFPSGDDTALARSFEHACKTVADWPLPGQGRTDLRYELLATWTSEDVVLGRLIEAHADAIAILCELEPDLDRGLGTFDARRWAVWAAGPPDSVTASRHSDRWTLAGSKRWCSGARLVTHALVDAASDDGQRLYAVDLADPGVTIAAADWIAGGMGRADTRRVEFRGTLGVPVGEPGQYLSRPGFWAGAIGVAACWHGATAAVAEPLRHGQDRDHDVHTLVHVGAIYAALLQNQSMLRQAARNIDSQPASDHAVLARSVRATVERNASAVIDRIGRALGPRPLAYDRLHAQAVDDLAIYIRQDHAERDLERLGRDVVGARMSWPL